jgi:CheY-like chemotaxis protein
MHAVPTEEQTTAGRPTVVVIEDDPPSFDLLRVYLESVGVRIVGARDGEEGLAVVRRLAPAAVLLDIVLPGMDGWDVLAQLKADPTTAPIPVIVVSMLDERGRGVAVGASEYLVKPISKAALLAALHRAVRLHDDDRAVVAIDDDPLALQLFRATLEPEGWTVHCATSGPDGLALVREHQPSVILLDLLMPDMDGFEVVEALHADPETASVPVVVLTSKSMSAEDKERLRGRISYVGGKAEFRAADLAQILQQASEGRPWTSAERA